MESFSLLKELANVLADTEHDKRNARTLLAAAHEASETIRADEDFQRLFPNDYPLLLGYLGRFPPEHSNQLPSSTTRNRLLQYINKLLRYQDQYLRYLIDSVEHVLTSEDCAVHADGTGRKRILDRIFTLTNRLLSLLLSRGYSSTYLYNRVEALTHLSRYKNRTFKEQLSSILDRLKLGDTTYRAIYPITCSKKSFLNHTNILGMHVLRDTAEIHDDLKHLDIDASSFDGFLVGQIDAPDYISAAWRMQNRAQKARDISVFEYKSEVVQFAEKCLVVHDENESTHHHSVRINLLQSLLIRRSDLYPTDMSDLLNQVFSSPHTDAATLDTIDRVFRYYRLGVVESTFESKLLSMWIALEALVDFAPDNPIDTILELVPALYAYDSIVKRIRFIHQLLDRYGIDIPFDLREEICSRYEISELLPELNVLYIILSDDNYCRRLYNEIGNDDYVRYRIVQTHKDLNSKKSVESRILNTKTDVRRQLVRIYYVRNNMVHRGRHEGFDIRVYGHLCEYIGCILSEVLAGIALSPSNPSVHDVLSGYLIGLEKKFVNWSDSDILSFNDVVFLNPEF